MALGIAACRCRSARFIQSPISQNVDAISGWGWSAGLRPAEAAPVWPMALFRNRFLSAFSSPAPGAAPPAAALGH